MTMSNAELEVALKAALQRLVTALANKVAPDSLKLEGKSLAEITSLILAGKAATAGTADNALTVGDKSLSTIESERNTQLVAAIDALRTELESDIGNVTAESIGLGNVVNYGVATEVEALAGAADKYVTAMLAVKIAQTKIDEIVNAAPETLNTLSEIAAALNNDPDVINTLMSNIAANATTIEALEQVVAALDAKVMGYFDVDGNANNTNLFAGKTLNEVLDMARDGVDMSNVVLKTDDFGPYTVALESDTTTQEVPVLVETADSATAMTHVVRVGEVVTVEVNDGAGNYSVVTESEMGGNWVLVQEAINGREGDFDQYYEIGTTNKEVTVAARTLKALFEALELADKNTQARITSELEGLSSKIDTDVSVVNDALVNWTNSVQQSLERIDTYAGETRQMVIDNQQALGEKVGVGSNIDTNLVTVDDAEVSLAQAISNIKDEIANTGQASGDSLALLEQKVDAFIAAKATGEEAITGTDDAKYITALALKAALDALDLSGKLDVNAQAADSAKLEGLTLTEIITQIMGGEGSEGLTLTSLQDALDVLSGRVTATESDKLDATAQAVDSALLEGRSVADLTASGVEATSGVVTDKFMTPSTSKAALDAHWAEKVGAAPETLDTIEEIAAALRNAPDALDALESVAKEYTDTEVLAAIDLISGVDLVTGTTLASLYTSVQNLETTKLDVDAQAVDSAKLEGYTLSEVMDAAIQPGRLFYPVIHVNGSLDEASYTMPTPADAWAQVQTNAVLEQVETVYAIAIKRLLPGNLLNVLSAEGVTLIGAVSTAQEGPDYVIMRAGIEDEVWTPVVEYKFACLARLARNCIIVGENTSRFVPGQTLFYNGFEGLSGGVYYDWTMLADKEWDTFVITDNNIVIDTAEFHRSDIRIQATGPVSVTFDLDVDLPFQMDLRFVNQTGVDVTFVGANVFSAPRMEAYTMSKTNGVVVATIQTNAMVNLTGDLEEAFFINPDYVAG